MKCNSISSISFRPFFQGRNDVDSSITEYNEVRNEGFGRNDYSQKKYNEYGELLEKTEGSIIYGHHVPRCSISYNYYPDGKLSSKEEKNDYGSIIRKFYENGKTEYIKEAKRDIEETYSYDKNGSFIEKKIVNYCTRVKKFFDINGKLIKQKKF